MVVRRLTARGPETRRSAAAVGPADVGGGDPGDSPSPAPTVVFSFLHPPVEPDEIGRLGGYRVLRLLGQGGMGLVFHAEDLALQRAVALKVMKPELAADGGWERFLREARALAAIKHDHLVTIYQAGQDGSAAYYAMELLSGETLAARLRRDPRPPLREVLRVGRELADGLSFIHASGLVHRDLKPANIWLEWPHGRVKILDFGLARPVQADGQLTQPGQVVGTPAFMSPEQAWGQPVDGRSDLFSLGCVLYELCTGAPPFGGSNFTARLTALTVETPVPVRELNPQVPQPLAGLVMRLLEKRPEDRPTSAALVRDKLDRIARRLAASTPARPETAGATERQESPARKRPRTTARRPSGRRLPVVLAAGLLGIVVVGVVLGLTLKSLGFSLRGHAEGETTSPTEGTPAASGPVYLADLKPVAAEHWPQMLPPTPTGERPGEVIRKGGRVVAHGLFMHPAPPGQGPASVTYRLDKQYSTFRSEASLNDGVPPAANPCVFKVFGDGRLLWESRPVRSQADTQACAVSVRGVNELRLAVTCAGEPFGAHTIWVDPAVSK
jgi:serine/threonine protein kinase